MADGLAIALAQIATQQALNEVSLLLNFKNDFKWLEKKLRQICASLQAADEQSEHNNNVKEWLAEVKNIAFDAEDIIDECAVEHLYTNASQSCVCSYSQLIFRYKMGKRIRDLKDRIRSITQEGEELQLFHNVTHLSQPSTSTSEREREAQSKRWSILDKDSPAVAMEHKVEEILRLIEKPAVGVVAVIGMGGLGKTFLLQHVYDRIKHRYDYSAWIAVSQACSVRSLQGDLAYHINLQIEGTITDLLAAELIYRKLEGKRCLIVLDDVWSSSVHGNLISRLGLPTGRNNQCKILVTTRSRDVASNMNAHIYEMQHLFKEDSYNLFCMFAFPDLEGNRPPEELKSLAHQIVEECGRLPLAIKTVAASMASSSSLPDWQSKLQQLKDIVKVEDYTMQLLKLSYDSLPSHLKPCFAYFSFFSEDTKIYFSRNKPAAHIYQDYVIYLWIAEGFIPQEKEKEQFDIGLNYLHQLENLCLMEVNRVLSCYTIHDLLLDLAVNICKEHDCDFDLPFKDKSCRRLLLAKKDIATDGRPLHCQRVLRTLSISHNPDIKRIPGHLFDHPRVLRVIDFSCTGISTLPKSVEKLKLLKVLNLSHTEIREVPDCIRRLKSLLFLDVSACTSLRRLPDWIGELKCLSYLAVDHCSEDFSNSPLPKGISKLSNLRTLRSCSFPLSIEENEFLSLKDVSNLINLQEINFRLNDVEGLRSVENGILEHLVKMRILSVWNGVPATEGDIEESNLPAFPEKMNVMKDLQQLYLFRFSVPSWICGMTNVNELSLSECSDYPSLQKMPNLQTLFLLNDSKCRALPRSFGECGGFPKLVSLFISNMPLLEELPALEEEAMQRLEGLTICSCPRVKKVPEGLERLTRLKEIRVDFASGKLMERLRESGEDWSKIKANNPNITITY